MPRDLSFEPSALKEAAEYQVTATFYVDQATMLFERYPKQAAAYYRAAIRVLEHAHGLLNGYPLGEAICRDIQIRIETFRAFASDLDVRAPIIERGGRRG